MKAPKQLRALGLSAILLCLSGCVPVYTAAYTPPKSVAENGEYSATVPRSFDETWSALVDHAAGTFFSIENFEKESGLMTLAFGSNDPSAFVDCGLWVAESGAQTFNGKYLDFIVQYYAATMTGKMNILVKQQGPTSSFVRVNARYIVNLPPRQLSGGNTWSFDSGGHAEVTITNPAKNSPPTRTCQPTYKAERNILEAVKKLAATN